MKAGIEHLIAVVGIIVAAITACYSASVAYDIHSRGEIPEKNIRATVIGPIDPFGMGFDPTLGLSASLDGVQYENLQIATIIISNSGKAPIIPSDVYTNIGVTVKEPYKIVSVYSPSFNPSTVTFKWHKVSDTLFQADPALLNPGDSVQSVALVTDGGLTKGTSSRPPSPEMTVVGRVANMRGFSRDGENLSLGTTSWIWVSLYNYQLVFFIVLTLVCLTTYLILFRRAGLSKSSHETPIVLVLLATMLSAAGSEATATYVFGTYKGVFVDYAVSNWLNAPWMALNVLTMLALYAKKPR